MRFAQCTNILLKTPAGHNEEHLNHLNYHLNQESIVNIENL